MNSNDDNKLKSFMHSNAPVAPQAPPDELRVLLKRIDADGPVGSSRTMAPKSSPWSFSSSAWLGGGAAIAASVFAFLMVTQPSRHSSVMGERQNEVATVTANAAAYAEDEEFDSLELNVEGPANEVGDEYLGLIADY